MKNVGKIFLVAALALFSFSLYAQQQEVLTFTRIERNPRAAGLAGAGAASVGSTAYASFVNSAIIPFSNSTADFAAGYEYWAPSLGAAHAINLAGAYRIGNIGLSLGGVYQMEQKDFDGFRPGEVQIGAGFGMRILPWLGLGLNARYVQENMFQGHSQNGFGLDAMAFFAPVWGLTLTAGVANIGSKVKDTAGNAYPQPASIVAAAAYYLVLGVGSKHGIEFMLDENYYLNSRTNAISVGMEYSYDRLAFARVGYRIASENAVYPSHLSLGLGVQYAGFRLDVSYLTLSEIIGNSVSVGLGYRF